jgi:Pin2-interacting protein X1
MTSSELGSGPSMPIVGKKLMAKLGGMVNESAASGVSDFARRQMEKMGWTEGKGLGKKEQGIVTHVRVKKREEFMGVGVEKVKVEEQQNQWWYNVYDKLANKIQIDPDSDDEKTKDKKKKSKKKNRMKKQKKKNKKKENKRKRSSDSEADNSSNFELKDQLTKKKQQKTTNPFRIPTDEELFAATGGKLFGRRAYGSCAGKLKRDQLHLQGKLCVKSSTTTTTCMNNGSSSIINESSCSTTTIKVTTKDSSNRSSSNSCSSRSRSSSSSSSSNASTTPEDSEPE